MRRAALLVPLLAWGCASEGTHSVFRAAQPLPHRSRVERGEVQPVGLEGVEPGLAYGAKVGLHHRGRMVEQAWDYEWGKTLALPAERFTQIAQTQLEEAGLAPLPPQGLVTAPEEAPEPRFALSGTITRLQFESFDEQSGNYSVANLAVEWRLTDREIQRRIWTKTTHAGATVEGVQPKAVLEAFRKAAREAATDPELVQVLRVDPAALRSPITGDLLPESRKAPTTHALSDQLWLSQDSVVSLKTDRGFFSGFFISADGLVATSHLPVQGRRQAEVILKNRARLAAEVVRVDAVAGIALLRVEGRGFPALPLGSAESLEPGAQVFVIANPAFRESSESVLRGNNRGPRLLGGRQYLQTDAPRVEGAAGAPVLDLAGNVVAVMTDRTVPAGNETLSLAVPVELVKDEVRVYAAGGILPQAVSP